MRPVYQFKKTTLSDILKERKNGHNLRHQMDYNDSCQPPFAERLRPIR